MRLNSTRLGRANLDRLPPGIRRPAYDRSRVTPGIVHLGLGAFHRAHQAVVIDDCLASGTASWGIVGASLRSPDTRDALAPQDHLYTVAVRAAEGTEHRVIGALLDSVVAREKPAALVDRMADPAIRIVSLTVTEKGYCHTPQTGDLDERHPDVVHDLNNFDAPRSAPGFIVAALARRRAQGLAPFTVLDETYRGMWLAPTNTVLLTTDNPTGDPPVAWVSAYPHSRVVTIQLGHGPESHRDASYRRLVLNAITWTAARPN